jgi:hypothetical protein
LLNYETPEQCNRELKRLIKDSEGKSEWIKGMMRERYRDVMALKEQLEINQAKQERLIE